MSGRIDETLRRIIDRDRSRGFDDPERLEAHYREEFGVEIRDLVEAAAGYFRGSEEPPLSVAISLAGRMLEVGWALRGGGFVVVGRDDGERSPALASGPFRTREKADEFRDLLAATTSGKYTVLSLNTPLA